MIKSIRIVMISFVLLLLSNVAFAAKTWQIIPDGSSLNFTATQNGSPVKGQFKKFTAEISFDPSDLASSKIMIDVDINSIDAPNFQVSSTLKTPDWFNVQIFPHAIFKAHHFTKVADNTYKANGFLTIRDKTVPVVLTFKLSEYSDAKAVAIGSTTLKRTQFGVGQGDWSNTDTIKNDVEVQFTVTAKK